MIIVDNYIVDSFGIFESLHHFLMKFGVGDLGTDSDSALNCFFNLSHQGLHFSRSIDILRVHSTLSCIKSTDLEKSMCFFNVLNFHLSLQMNSSDGL